MASQGKIKYAPRFSAMESHVPSGRIPFVEDFHPACEEGEPVLLSTPAFHVRYAMSPESRAAVQTLINRMYAWRGYQLLPGDESPQDANRVVLQACADARRLGTVTLGFDGKQKLAADALYSNELDRLRRQDRRILEVTRLAVDAGRASKDVLHALFQLVYAIGCKVNQATDVVIEINPRHASYYKRVLGFRQIGDTRICHRVAAPAVLLHRSVCEFPDRLVTAVRGALEHPITAHLETAFLHTVFGSSIGSASAAALPG
jgi:hypothetical protein